MHHDELQAWLRLTLSPGVGNSTARRLLARFGLNVAEDALASVEERALWARYGL